MGVSRLWTYINENKDSVISYVDLVEEAKGFPGRMKILVDFYSWEHFIKKYFWKTVNLQAQNSFLVFDGGEYKLMDKFIRNIIDIFRSINIELVFYLDGAKGSGYQSTRQKMQTWKSRYCQDHERLKKIFQFLRGEIPMTGVDLDHITRPCLQEVQNILTLQDAGCSVHLRVSGEADYILAKHLKEDKEAFGIFSNDTDFLIFPNSVFLSQDFFDVDNDLGLGTNFLEARKPRKLTCGIIRSESIAHLLGLPNSWSLIELAIIGGNDFTLPYLQTLPPFKSHYWGKMEKLAQFIRHYGTAEECEFFGEAIQRHHALRQAVQHSRQFYSLSLEDEEENERGYIFGLIADGIRQGKFPSTIVAMHRGSYWHRQVLEDPTPGLPTAEGALTSLRSYIYAILLPHHRQTVTEICRTPHQSIDQVEVRKIADSQVPSLAQVKKNSFSKNLWLFEIIMQHQDPDILSENKSYFKLYGMRLGFVCFLLRYFLVMNWQQNLYLSAREFFVVAAWIMGNHNDQEHIRMKIVPSPRCCTVGNWFQSLYRNAYAFLGNILGLSHEFPSPKDLFSGATWVALYTGYAVFEPNPDFREPTPLGVSMDALKQTSLNVEKVVMDHRHIVKNIIRGFFPFE